MVEDPGKTSSIVLPTFKLCCEDKSWRVRKVAAKGYAEVTEAIFGKGGDLPGAAQTTLIECYTQLLRDPEAEVRGCAALNISKVLSISWSAGGESVFKESIAPSLDDLSKDSTMDVRAKLAQALMEVASPSNPSVSDDTTIAVIRPIISAMLSNEEESDEVKNYILSKLPMLGKLLKSMDEVVAIVKGLSK